MTTAQTAKSNQSDKPTALVAGGAGFIGSHLVQTLLTQNFKVVCVDNFSTGKKENLKEFLTSPDFTLIEFDINDPSFKLPEELKIDYCFHLASIEEYLSKGLSLDTLLVNSLGTKQLLEIARSKNAKFILVSSADLYSGAISSSSLRYYFGKTPSQEAVLSTHEAKRFSEALAFEYYKKYKLPLTIIRLKDVYGPRMNFDRGDEVSKLLAQAINKENLQVPGDGLQIINPTYVSDVIFGLIKASVGDFSGEIFILVNKDKITLQNFAQTVKFVAGPLEIENTRSTENIDFASQHFDLENTIDKLIWKPRVSLAEGVSSVIHQAKMATTDLETETEQKASPSDQLSETEIPKVAKSKNWLRTPWLRLGIFLTALGLLLLTVFYPLGSFFVSAYFGTKNLEDSYQSLLAEHNELAVEQAYKAQNSFQTASSSLNNLSWLLKMVSLSEVSSSTSSILASSAGLAEAIRSSSRGNQVLILAAQQAALSPDQASQKLDEALDNLYAAEGSLEESSANLSEISWEKQPSLVLPEQDFLIETNASLAKQVEELLIVIEENLAKPSLEE